MSKIVFYKGRKGSGKTLTMVKDGYQYFKDGRRILRNFNLAFGDPISNEEILKLDKFSEVDRCVLMIDEIQIFFNARRAMQKANINFSNFIQQIRKRDIILLCTAQFSRTIDIIIRENTDITCNPNFISGLNVCEAVYIDSTNQEDVLLGTKEPRMVKIVYDAEPLFPLFETEQMIK